MVKTPEFEERIFFGATSEKRPVATPESIRITEGAVVDLRYKGKTASIRVTKVVRPQAEFEGAIEAFEHEPEHADLKQGEVVRFTYDKIQHIHKWEEGSEPQELSSGDLNFTPDAAQLTLSSDPPTVSVKQVRTGLDAVIAVETRGVLVIHGVATFLNLSRNLNFEDPDDQAIVDAFRAAVDALKNELASKNDQIAALNEVVAAIVEENVALREEDQDLRNAAEEAASLGQKCRERFLLRLSEKAANGIAIGMGVALTAGALYLVGRWGGEIADLFSGPPHVRGENRGV